MNGRKQFEQPSFDKSVKTLIDRSEQKAEERQQNVQNVVKGMKANKKAEVKRSASQAVDPVSVHPTPSLQFVLDAFVELIDAGKLPMVSVEDSLKASALSRERFARARSLAKARVEKSTHPTSG